MTGLSSPGNESRQLREELILELARTRPGFGRELSGGDLRESERSSPTCGDRIRVRAEVRGGVLTGISWDGRGCAVSTASAGVLSTLAPGTRVDRVAGLIDRIARVVGTASAETCEDDAIGDMGLFAGIGRLPLRGRCAMLPWEALAGALQTTRSSAAQEEKRRAS